MSEESPEDLDRQGLIARSYDSLFSVRRRIRTVGDITLPIRQGLTYAQVGVGVLAVVVQIVTYGFGFAPLMRLLHIDLAWWMPLLWILGPAVLLAQRIVKSMPHGKGIPDTVVSWCRYLLDDPVHRRGVPVSRSRQPRQGPVAHYQREWVMYDEYTAAEGSPGEESISDQETERRFCIPTEDFQEWWDEKAIAHAREAEAERNTTVTKEFEEVGSRRGTAARAIIPDSEDRN